MEKLELKLRNLEYFVIRLKDITTEEMIELLQVIGEMKKDIIMRAKALYVKDFALR